MEPPPLALLPPLLSLAVLMLTSGCGTAASLRGRGFFVIFMAANALAGISCTLLLGAFFCAPPFGTAALSVSSRTDDLPFVSGVDVGIVAVVDAGADADDDGDWFGMTDGSYGGQTRSPQSGCIVDVITSGSAALLVEPALLSTVPVFRALISRSSSCRTSSNRSAAALREADADAFALVGLDVLTFVPLADRIGLCATSATEPLCALCPLAVDFLLTPGLMLRFAAADDAVGEIGLSRPLVAAVVVLLLLLLVAVLLSALTLMRPLCGHAGW